MKRFVWPLMAGLVLMFSSSPVPASSETLTMNGVWWQKLPQDARVHVVEGMLDAYETGYLQGSGKPWFRITKTLREKSIMTSLSQRDFKAILDAASLPKQPGFNKPFGSYVEKITNFYSKYPSRINLRVGALVGCMRDDADYTCDDLGQGKPAPLPQ